MLLANEKCGGNVLRCRIVGTSNHDALRHTTWRVPASWLGDVTNADDVDGGDTSVQRLRRYSVYTANHSPG